MRFRSFQKEQQGAIRSFALFKKSKKEQFTLSLFSKRAIRSFALLKRAQKSKVLFRSFEKEQQRANRSFALFKKSERAQKERIALSLFFSLFLAKKRAIRSFRKRAIAQP